jgi:RNA polymerase sigma-70 factor (ECF subfamily)
MTAPAGSVSAPPSPPLGVDECFAAHRATAYRWAASLGADHQAALDAVQEAFLRMLRTAPRFDSAAAQLGWLRRVVANLVADHHRSRRASRPLSDAAFGPADDRALDRPHPDDARAAADAIASLSEMQRLVLVAKVADGLTFQQVAAELGVAVPTVKTHYLRALAALRDRLGLRDDTPTRTPRDGAPA